MFTEFKVPAIWVIFWCLTMVVLTLESRRVKAECAANGTTNFNDRSLRTYAIWALLVGGLVLVMYFSASRRGKKGGLVGVGALVGVLIVTALLGGVYTVAAKKIDHAQAISACAVYSESDPDGSRCRSGAFQFQDEREALLKAGCDSGQVEPCLDLSERRRFSAAIGEQIPWDQEPSYLRAKELCAKRPAHIRRGRCDVFDIKTR